MKIFLLGDIGSYTDDTRIILKNINSYINKEDVYFLLGDNFYPNGVNDINDNKWNNISIYKETNNIYPILGNHDYLGCVQSQIDCKIPNWKLENYYYMKTFDNIDFFFIDTSILLPNHSNLNADIIQSNINKNIVDLKNEMLEWLNIKLNESKNTKVLIGHYPMVSYGVYGINNELMYELLPIIKKYDIKYYISGHDHNLQIIDIISETFNFKQVISGSTSYLYPVLTNKSDKIFYEFGYIVIDTTENTITIMNSINQELYKESFI